MRYLSNLEKYALAREQAKQQIQNEKVIRPIINIDFLVKSHRDIEERSAQISGVDYQGKVTRCCLITYGLGAIAGGAAGYFLGNNMSDTFELGKLSSLFIEAITTLGGAATGGLLTAPIVYAKHSLEERYMRNFLKRENKKLDKSL
ncbi:hypothetical protein J4466_04990 [Candidatus Pacearchaeota archaeon]|nr:hypothetical protein [Candidatus Pacearchaeota archaeon]